MKRRTVLALGAGAGAAALSAAFVIRPLIPVIPKRPAPDANAARGWIRHFDDRFVLVLPRVEFGQNIATALKQVACDELGVTWDEVDLKLHTTLDIGRVRSTVGSESIKEFAVPLAQACAALRDALLSGRTDGEVSVEPRAIEQLRAFGGNTRYVGRQVALEQSAKIVRGDPVYAADIRRDGMVYGRVLRAAASSELRSRPVEWNDGAAERVPGFISIVEDSLLMQGNSSGLGILAQTPGALDSITEALDVRWQVEGGFDQPDIDQAVDVDLALDNGAVSYDIENDGVDGNGAWDIDLRFDIPLAAHGFIEPRAAVAEFAGNGSLALWVGSQDVFYVRDVLVRQLGLDEDKVDVHSCRVGGAFGGKTICTVELEAAVLARAARLPVKVQWTRTQEYGFGFHRAPSSHRIRARLVDGRLDTWWHAFSSSHILFTNAAMPEWMQKLTDFIGDFGVARGARLPYRAGRKRIEYALNRLPVLTGPWRGLGAGPNLLAIESGIDECSRKAKIDPVAFRLSQIDDPRLARVLKRAAGEANWNGKIVGSGVGSRRGRGVACGIYKEMSYAAVVADVEVGDRGTVKLTHLWCAHDCGRVINPDQVRAQCEGNMVWGIGMVLTDRLQATESLIDAENFGDAPIPGIEQVPPMTVSLVDEGDPPTGAGETAIVAAAAAIANAIRDATGVRVTRFPVTVGELGLTQS